MLSRVATALVILVGCGGGSELTEQSALTSSSLGRGQAAGWDALVDWEALPTLTRERVHMFSSSERENSGIWFPYDAGNKDYNNFLAVCGARPALTYQYVDNAVSCAPGEEGYLLAAVDGAGYVSRMGFGGATLDLTAQIDSGLPIQPHPTDELIKIYVDDAKEPVYVGRWSDWDKAVLAPFTAPLTGWSSGLIVSYVPISFEHRLRVFADQLDPLLYTYYYQVAVHSREHSQPFDAAALSSKQAQAELDAVMQHAHGAVDAQTWIDTLVRFEDNSQRTIWERAEHGTIERLTFMVDERALSQVSLRMFWDDELEPAIDVSLAELFGGYQKPAEFQTWPMQVQRVAGSLQLSLALPMPFAKRARLALAATSGSAVQVKIEGRDAQPPEPWGHLYARRQTRTRPNLGERFDVAELNGPGKYVGTMLYMRGGPNAQNIIPGPMPLNFLEGDDHIELDGSTYQGTGTEETFNGGWYFSDGRFDSPFAALLNIEQSDPKQGAISAVRWYVLSDSLPFQEHFKLSYEYGANPETAFEYSAVAFYYQ